MRRSVCLLLALLASCGRGSANVHPTVAPNPAATTPDAGAPATPPPPAARVKPPALRLPGDVAPTGYALELTVDPTKQVFEGKITIALQVKQATQLVWLNGTDLTIDEAIFTVGGVDRPARVVPGDEDFVGFA